MRRLATALATAAALASCGGGPPPVGSLAEAAGRGFDCGPIVSEGLNATCTHTATGMQVRWLVIADDVERRQYAARLETAMMVAGPVIATGPAAALLELAELSGGRFLLLDRDILEYVNGR